MIGDCHTAALVSSQGSIDWYCPGRFDAPAVFCRILDTRRGGFFRVAPSGRFSSERRYRGSTNVLETTFVTETGRARMVDLMPIHTRKRGRRGYDVGTEKRILRLVEGVDGSVEMEIAFRPTFDYARAVTGVEVIQGRGAVARGGDHALALSAPGVSFDLAPDGTLRGTARLGAGERLSLALTDVDTEGDVRAALEPPDSADELRRTLRYWERWSAACTYDGPYRREVLRSALALKLLDYEPSGALVAAPTASLPVDVGGVRNWHYRYTWLRNAALVLYALHLIGYGEEAMDFFDWMGELGISGLRLRERRGAAGGGDRPRKRRARRQFSPGLHASRADPLGAAHRQGGARGGGGSPEGAAERAAETERSSGD